MEQIRKPKSEKIQAESTADVTAIKDEKIEADKHLSDELLDEIDSLLEGNAAAFVQNYKQRGGE